MVLSPGNDIVWFAFKKKLTLTSARQVDREKPAKRQEEPLRV